MLLQKAQQSLSQRERDRRAREKERQLQREGQRGKQRELSERDGAKPPVRKRSRERALERFCEEGGVDDDTLKGAPLTLPGGLPIPTTPAGRRLAARAGGAEHAAIVSAAAREAEKVARD